MNKRRGFLSALIGLFIIIGLAGVTGCASEEPPQTLGYSGYVSIGNAVYEGHVMNQRLTMDQVEERVKDYLRDLNDSNIQVEEIIEFANRFYVRFSEKDTGINAFAALINPFTGRMYAWHHADKFWNTKYKGESYRLSTGEPQPIDWPSGPMTITEGQALSNAAEAILGPRGIADADVGSAQPFYGYYTIPILRQGNVIGLVNVNGYTGTVCYESCHGSVLDSVELR